jgi:hypothetical protein
MEFSNIHSRDPHVFEDDQFIFPTSNEIPHSRPATMVSSQYVDAISMTTHQSASPSFTSFSGGDIPAQRGMGTAFSDEGPYYPTLHIQPSRPASPRGYGDLGTTSTSRGRTWDTMISGTGFQMRDPNYTPAANASTIDPLARQRPNHYAAPRTPQLNHHPTSFQCKWQGCRSSRHFRREADLIRHIRTIHISPYAHPCYVEGCDRSFGRKDHLQEHLRRCHHLG